MAEPRATYEKAAAEAKTAFREALMEAYPGPTSDNPTVMDRLLGKFLRECQKMLR